mgnify:FL=1
MHESAADRDDTAHEPAPAASTTSEQRPHNSATNLHKEQWGTMHDSGRDDKQRPWQCQRILTLSGALAMVVDQPVQSYLRCNSIFLAQSSQSV